MNTADAIARRKRRWELAELGLEIASLIGGALVIWGLWAEGLPAFGSKLVLAGVVIEVAFGWCVLVASRKLQAILETEIAQLQRDAAASAEKQAEAELKLEQLRKDTARRSVLGSKEFRKALAEVPKAEILQVSFPRDDGEAFSFAFEIATVLHELGWSVGNVTAITPRQGFPFDRVSTAMSVGGGPTGVTIVTRMRYGDEPSDPTVEALRNALVMPSSPVSIAMDSNLTGSALRLVVGARR